MGRFTVYSKDGQTVRCVLDKLEYTGVFMAERACTSTFISDVKINFDVFDYIDYRGERFELELLPTVKKISKHQYSYDLNFVSLKYELERCMMRNIVPSDNGIVYPTPLVVEFTGTVKYLAERIQACLDAMYGKGVWSITLADGVDSEEKNISMSNQNCWSALSLVNTEYKLNYFVKGRSVTIGGAEPVVNNVFEYGKGKGLYEIERISDADTGIVTKLRAYGGTRNLDYSYPKKPEWTDSILPANYALSPLRLMLPSFKTDGVTDFVLASNEAIAKYGIREGVITYDDIYPSITGMKNSAGQAIDEIKSVDAITSETQPTFTVQLYDLGFDLNESLTTDEEQLSMKSGALQGYAFTITKIVKASDGSYTLTLGRNTLEEADTDNFTVPNKDWNMKAGDKFVLLNILMPQEYIRAAENRLLERAKEYIAKYSSTNYSYNIGVDEIFMARNANFYNEIMEGKRLTVNDPEMGIDHENVIIQSLSIKEGEGLIPTFEVTLNNEPSASTLERIQGQISEIETSVNNKFSSQSELSKQYRKKLDKVVWDRNLEERVDDNGKEYLFLTKPLITAYGVTMYAGADVQVPSIYEGLPIDGVTIQWVDGKLVATGGKGTANGIVVNGDTYTPNEDGIITLPNYPSLSGYATEQWVNNTLSGYATSSSLSQLSAKVDNFLEGTDTDGIINKWKELESFLAGQTQTSTLAELLSVKADKATTIAGYGITDAYTKNDISGLLADYVTKSGAQDITGVKSFINGLNIGDILVKKHSDGVVELDGDLILTGSLTMFAQGSHTASTILDALPIDETTLSKEGDVLSVIGGVGGGSVDGIILNGTTYSPDEATKLITLPNYPTTLPASDVYSWAKQPNKPSYSFDELSSHPTTLGGYGITDAYTKSDADGKYVLKAGDTVTGDLSVAGQLFAGNEQFVATLLYTFIGRDKGIYFSNDANNGSLYVNTHYDRRHQAGSFIINEANGVVTFQNNPTVKSNTILHTGNYAGVLDSRYFRHIGDTYEDGRNTGWIGFGTGTYIEAYPDGIAHKIYSYGQVTSFNSSYSRLELYSTHTSSDPNDGNNGIQFRSGWNDDKKSWRMLLDEVNYLHYTDNRYVNKAGDTMTGNLVFAHTSERPSYSGSIGITFREQIANGQGVKLVYNDYDNYRAPAGLILVGEQGGEYFEAPAIYQNGYKVWDAGNKRDMFSSMIEAFTTWGNEQVISVEGDVNTYYPVVITINHSKTWNSRIAIHKNLGSRTPSYPGNHGSGTSSMWAMYEGRYSGWDGNSGYIVTKYVRQPYANLISKAEHAGNSVGALVVYLRGGGCEYTVCTDYRGGINVYYERTEISGGSNFPVYVEPTTSVGNQGVLNLVSYDYLVQKAVRLETPRYIYGNLFNGTSDIPVTAIGKMRFLYFMKNDGSTLGYVGKGSDHANNLELINYEGSLILGANQSSDVIITTNHNVGIGTTSPAYKLHVTGSLMCEGEWIRNTGDCGWYNATHDGGIYMTDNTYVKVYGKNWFRSNLYSAGIDGFADDSYSAAYNACAPNNDNYCCYSLIRSGTYAFGIGFNTNNEIWLGSAKSDRKAGAQWLQISSGQVTCSNNLLAKGGITMYSDLRKKNVLNSIIVPLDVMANADLFDYTFKTDEKCKVRAGTSAQYWNVFLPQVTDTDNEGFFTMSYDVLATTCVLSIAKHFQRFLMEDFNNHETRIEFLERENKELKDSNKEMMNRIIELERRAA